MMAPASPAAAAAPKVTITAGPTVNADDSVSLTYSINRQSKSIASRVCTVDTATSSTTVGCGSLPATKTNPTVANVTVSGLADGTYTFTVRFTLTGGGGGTTTSAPFTIETSPTRRGPRESAPRRHDRELVAPSAHLNARAAARQFTAGRIGSLRSGHPDDLTAEVRGRGRSWSTSTPTSGGLATGSSRRTTTYTGNGNGNGFDLPLSQPVSLTQGTQYAIGWGPDCGAADPATWSTCGGGQAYAGGQALANRSGAWITSPQSATGPSRPG